MLGLIFTGGSILFSHISEMFQRVNANLFSIDTIGTAVSGPFVFLLFTL